MSFSKISHFVLMTSILLVNLQIKSYLRTQIPDNIFPKEMIMGWLYPFLVPVN